MHYLSASFLSFLWRSLRSSYWIHVWNPLHLFYHVFGPPWYICAGLSPSCYNIYSYLNCLRHRSYYVYLIGSFWRVLYKFSFQCGLILLGANASVTVRAFTLITSIRAISFNTDHIFYNRLNCMSHTLVPQIMRQCFWHSVTFFIFCSVYRMIFFHPLEELWRSYYLFILKSVTTFSW